MKWIKETGKDYIAYSQGNYYKVNNAIIWRKNDRIILRNTYTGNEVFLSIDDYLKNHEKEAIKQMNNFKKMIDEGIIKAI